MNQIKKYIENVLCIKIDGEITQEHIALTIERCEEILMETDSQYIYEIMQELECLLK